MYITITFYYYILVEANYRTAIASYMYIKLLPFEIGR